MATVVVGMCSNDCAFHTTRDMAMLVRRLDRYIKKAFARFANGPSLFIFIAPEFYFSRTAPNRYVSEAEKNQLITDFLPALSNLRNNLLLVPGSILWQHERGKTKSDQIRNTVPIFYRGALLQEYDKQEAGGEVVPADNAGPTPKWFGKNHFKYVPGAVDGLFTFSYSGHDVTAGIEVCMEHDTGRLAAAVGGGPRPRLHLVTANTVAYTAAHTVPEVDGLYVRCSATSAPGGFGPNIVGRYTAPGVWEDRSNDVSRHNDDNDFDHHAQPRNNGSARHIYVSSWQFNDVDLW